MAGYSSRSDQLWNVALQLVEEETQRIPFAQQEEHGQMIRTKYNQLVSNLSCVGDIIAAMYQKEKLTLKELEHIQHLQSTPMRANEELLGIIAKKPKDVFECFLTLINDTNQLHLYQMLTSSDETKREDSLDHKVLIRRNFVWLSEKLDAENELIPLLYQQNVLTMREKESILCINDSFQKNSLLLGLLSTKSQENFEKFMDALENSHQNHLTKELRTSKGSSADPSTVSFAVQRISHKVEPKEVHKSREISDPFRYFSKSVLQEKALPKHGQRSIPSRSLPKSFAPSSQGNQSKSAHAKSEQTSANHNIIEKIVSIQRTKGVDFQARLKWLDPYLQSDIAIKVTYIYLLYIEKPGDDLKMCLHILLQESHERRKEIAAANVETNMEMEQLRKIARQYSAAATLNEVFRTQLYSVQQELTSQMLQSEKDRMKFEDKIDQLKTEIRSEITKCKQLEKEKLLNSTAFTMEMQDCLNKAESDKLYYQQQIHELNNHLDESNAKLISLRTENEKLMEAMSCKIVRENEDWNYLRIQGLEAQETTPVLLTQVEEKKRTLEYTEKERLEPIIEPQNDAAVELSLQNDRMAYSSQEFDSAKHGKHELDDKLSQASVGLQLEQLNGKPYGNYNIAAPTQGEMPEKYDSNPVLLWTIRTNADRERDKSINGLTILDNELFVVRELSPEIEVYDLTDLRFSNEFNFEEVMHPLDITSCNKNKCLYIFYFKGFLGQSNEIYRVSVDGKLIRKWSTGEDFGHGLSVTAESNVILTGFKRHKLNEYSPDGQLIREIDLSVAGIRFPMHAIKLANGHFVVCHGSGDDDLHRVCIVNPDGKLMKSFGGKHGHSMGQIDHPVYLFVDGNGFVLVVDQGNKRVLLLDSNLEFKREILAEERHGLRCPLRILLDDSTSRPLLVESDWGYDGLIRVFQFFEHRSSQEFFI